MRNWFQKLRDRPESQPQSREEMFEQLYAGKLPPARKYPISPPEGADDSLKQFYTETEWLQPVLNMFACPEGFRFNEVDSPYVTLNTFDEPDKGRTFELSCGSIVIGRAAIVPTLYKYEDDVDWAELRIRLNYPVEMIDGRTVHGLLTSLIRLTQEFDDESFEGVRRDLRASTRASQAIVESIWDRMDQPSLGALVELTVKGPWTYFKGFIDHWKQKGIDPWERWERQRDSNSV